MPALPKNIVWLASYPKSGNTWARIFLANYLLNAPAPLPINQVQRIGGSDSEAAMYRRAAAGRYDPADHDLHLRLRGKILHGIAANGADVNFVKTHNMNTRVMGGALIDRRVTRAAVYILRHPLDVAISYARHFGVTPARACALMSRPQSTTMADERHVKQFIGSWADHVASWTRVAGFPVHVMKYEEMRADPNGCFTGMLHALGIPVDPERVDRAVRFSSFDELQRQEARDGFVEASRNGTRFFHAGSSGQWKDVLGPEDIAILCGASRAVMLEHGYL